MRNQEMLLLYLIKQDISLNITCIVNKNEEVLDGRFKEL